MISSISRDARVGRAHCRLWRRAAHGRPTRSWALAPMVDLALFGATYALRF